MENKLIIEALNSIFNILTDKDTNKDKYERTRVILRILENKKNSINFGVDPVFVLKWVLDLIDEPGNTIGDVKQLIQEKILTFE